MNQTDIEFLDDMAKCAMTALIAKSPYTTNRDVTVETLKQVHNSVARGAYSYALNMLKTRNEIIAVSDCVENHKNFPLKTSVETNSIGSISPGGFLSEDDKPVPEAEAYYGTELPKSVPETKQETKLICFLHGRPIRSDTELITIDRTTENFEEHGRDLKNTDDNNEKARIFEYLKHDARGWNNYLMEKPVLWLRNKPVYRDSVLLTRDSLNEPFTEEVGASDYDKLAGNNPIALLKEGDWGDYYKVK